MTKNKEPQYFSQNQWLAKLNDDLLQSKYNLKKEGLFTGPLKQNIEILLKTLKEDYDM